MRDRFLGGLLLVLFAAVLLLGFTSSYSAYVASTNHRNSCTSRALVLDTLHDLIVLATTPKIGQRLSAEQVREITAFQSAAFTRINQARC